MNTTNQTRNTNKRSVCGKFLQPRRRRHDRMLVLNMSLFNFEPGWNRIFKSLPDRENVWG
jgi:hypothetical protein